LDRGFTASRGPCSGVTGSAPFEHLVLPPLLPPGMETLVACVGNRAVSPYLRTTLGRPWLSGSEHPELSGWRSSSAGGAVVPRPTSSSSARSTSATTSTYDRQRLEDLESDVAVAAGWGINLALLASLGLAVFAVSLIRRRPISGNVPSAAPIALGTANEAEAAPSPPGDIAPQTSVAPVEAAVSISPTAELERLADLHDRGALTDEEFARAKTPVARRVRVRRLIDCERLARGISRPRAVAHRD
jgi:hypothetical protein